MYMNSMQKYDLIIVGGGILGLSHAYHALLKNKKVLLLEKNSQAIGASIRNFGQIVPSGFSATWQGYGRSSVKHYLDIASQADIAIRQEGSIYIASDDEEIQLLEELHQINQSNDYISHLLTAEECISRYPNLSKDYCKAGLFFPDEINADSQKTIPALTLFLIKNLGLDVAYNRTIIDIYTNANEVIAFDHQGDKWLADQLILCNGDEFSTLFPELFAESDITLVKLQMMETVPQKDTLKIPGSILTGWTIRRYESFQECPSYQDIKIRENEQDFQRRFGVHILFKQTAEGSVILGDSHEYADINQRDDLRLFETNEVVNSFMVDAASKIMDLDYKIARTWIGCYSQRKSGEIYHYTIDDRIHIVTAIGGKGMTGSLGWAEEHINKLF